MTNLLVRSHPNVLKLVRGDQQIQFMPCPVDDLSQIPSFLETNALHHKQVQRMHDIHLFHHQTFTVSR